MCYCSHHPRTELFSYAVYYNQGNSSCTLQSTLCCFHTMMGTTEMEKETVTGAVSFILLEKSFYSDSLLEQTSPLLTQPPYASNYNIKVSR